MRNLIILILGAAVVWLLIERNRLTDELATANTKADESQKTAETLQKQVALLTSPKGPGGQTKGSWLDPHLDRGAKALGNPQTDQGLKR